MQQVYREVFYKAKYLFRSHPECEKPESDDEKQHGKRRGKK